MAVMVETLAPALSLNVLEYISGMDSASFHCPGEHEYMHRLAVLIPGVHRRSAVAADLKSIPEQLGLLYLIINLFSWAKKALLETRVCH